MYIHDKLSLGARPSRNRWGEEGLAARLRQTIDYYYTYMYQYIYSNALHHNIAYKQYWNHVETTHGILI